MKVSFSLDIILGGWLDLKHQLTTLFFCASASFPPSFMALMLRQRTRRWHLFSDWTASGERYTENTLRWKRTTSHHSDTQEEPPVSTKNIAVDSNQNTKYKYSIVYKKRTEMYLADTLIRAYIRATQTAEYKSGNSKLYCSNRFSRRIY